MALRMARPSRKKNGIYQCRIVVPQELRQIIGKRELKQSLETRNPQEAKVRFGPVYAKFNALLENARKRLAGEDSLTSKDIAILADRWLKTKLEEVEQTGDYRTWFFWATDLDPETGATSRTPESPLLDSLSFAYRTGGDAEVLKALPSHIREDAKRLLEDEHLVAVEDSEEYQKLLLQLASRVRELVKHLANRELGRYSTPSFATNDGSLSIQIKQKGITILEAWEKYQAKLVREEGRVTANNRGADYYPAIAGLAEFLGDVPLTHVTPENLREYRDFLYSLPSRPKKAIKALPIREQAEKADELGLPTLTRATVRNRMIHVSALFEAAKDIPGSRVETNPVEKVKLPPRKSKQDAGVRKDYTNQELERIFRGSWFSSRNHPSRNRFGLDGLWFPIVLYYTGARREEIAMLDRSDVRKIQEVWAFDIRPEGEERTTKTGLSRLVPLHPDLIDLGFLEFVESKTDKILWSRLGNSIEGRGGLWSRHFKKYLIEIGVSQTIKPSHGFRHSFATLMRESGIDEPVYRSIMGHSKSTQTSEYGSFQLPLLASALSKLPSLPNLERVQRALILTTDE